MNRDWNVDKLEDLVEDIIDCEHKTPPYVENSDYFVVRTPNVRNARIIYTDAKFTTEEGFKEWTQRRVPKFGDVLLTREAPAGEMAMVPDKTQLCLGQRMVLIVPDSEKLSPDYLVQYFYGPNIRKIFNSSSIGTTVDRINIKDIRSLEIYHPSLSEQRKIAKILSTWDEAIESLNKLILIHSTQKRRLLQDLIEGIHSSENWSEVTLNDCCECLDNKRKPLNSTQRLSMKGEIPYWGANGVVDYINDFLFDETIVLLAEDGGYFNEYETRTIANISYGKSWVNNHAHILRAKDCATNEWIHYSLVHKNILPFINGGTRAKLNKSDMLKITIKLPPLKTQKEAVILLQSYDRLIEVLNSLKKNTVLQKQGLMQKLLTGKSRMVVE